MFQTINNYDYLTLLLLFLYFGGTGSRIAQPCLDYVGKAGLEPLLFRLRCPGAGIPLRITTPGQ